MRPTDIATSMFNSLSFPPQVIILKRKVERKVEAIEKDPKSEPSLDPEKEKSRGLDYTI